jgi:general nucleoside transport system ATP-binding protein
MAERHTEDTTGPAAHVDAPAVELTGITKAYPGVVANDRIDLAVRRGEVHCLLGENGAGKSTLMGILAGMVDPDDGAIRVDGREVRIDSPKRALELGIGMVYQHTTLVPTLSVVENLMLGAHDGLRLDVRGARARLDELAGMLGVELDPDAETGSLALGRQQQVEIIKALWRGSEVLILDEPTSMLTPQGVAELAKVLVRLKGQGLAVVLITHKLHEATSQGDRVTILKAGRVVGALAPADLGGRSADEIQSLIVGMMFGEQVSVAPEVVELQEHVEGHAPRRRLEGEPILELEDVTVAPRVGEIGVSDVSLALLPGEIMGVAGVDGNGQRELAEAISGQRPLAGGDIRFAGASLRRMRVSQRERLGLRYVTDDRLGEGTVGSLGVNLNLVLKRIGQAPFWRRGSIRRRVIDENARAQIEGFDIRAPGPQTAVANLSGGNVQKVVLARELSFDPRVVLYNKPTYGLDLRTTQAVRARIREGAERGVASLLISTDLEELLALCDRIAVIFRGRLTGVVENAPGAEQQVGELMVGGSARAEAALPGGGGR